MTTYTLIYEEDQSWGGMGFRIEGTTLNPDAYNMATSGELVAHDILEHSSLKDIGTIGDELKALGASWYVRGRWGSYNRNSFGSPYDGLANNLVELAVDIITGNKHYHQPVPKLAGCECSEDFDVVIETFRKSIKLELDSHNSNWSQSSIDSFIKSARCFLRRGYNDAKARYEPRLGRFGANNSFWAITDAVDKALKIAEVEGQRFKLKVNLTKAKAICEEEFYEVY